MRRSIAAWGCVGLMAVAACHDEPPPAPGAQRHQVRPKKAKRARSNVRPVRNGADNQSLAPLDDVWDSYCGDVSAKRSPVTLHVAPNGNDSHSGSLEAPLATLQGAQEKVTDLAHHDYVIIVRGGEYRGQTVTWTRVSPDARIHIRAASGETPVFDGRRPGQAKTTLPVMFHLLPENLKDKTNLTVQGLTIRNYIQFGIHWRGDCGRIFGNKIEQIGDAFGDCRAPADGGRVWIVNRPTPSCAPAQPDCCTEAKGDCWCMGFGPIDLQGGSHNLIKHNDIVDAVNHTKPKEIHGIYLAEAGGGPPSNDNLVEDNYVRNCTGTGGKVREGSNRNRFLNNYWERVNFFCLQDVGRRRSFQNALSGNVCNFWTGNPLGRASMTSPRGSTSLKKTTRFFFGMLPEGEGQAWADAEQDSPDYFQPRNDPGQPDAKHVEEVVSAMTSADVDGDGKAELFVALYYPKLGYSKVLYTDGGKDDLRTVAFSSASWRVTALTAIREPGERKAHVVSALHKADGEETRISVGRISDGQYRLLGGSLLHESSGPSSWHVSALTAAKVGHAEVEQLFVAAVVGGVQQIHRGDGRTAQSGGAMPGVTGAVLYTNAGARVTALSHGAVTGSSGSLLTALSSLDGHTPNNAVYMGDGITTAADKLVFDAGKQQVRALTVGDFGNKGAGLVTVLEDADRSRVYLGDTSRVLGRKLHEDAKWRVTSLATLARDGGAHELVAAFDQPEKTEIRRGSGATSPWRTHATTVYSFP